MSEWFTEEQLEVAAVAVQKVLPEGYGLRHAEALAFVRAALSAARPNEWQPIETAPKDGTQVIVWNGRKGHCASFDKVDYAWVSSFKTATRRLPVTPEPTHWMPLPPPPGE